MNNEQQSNNKINETKQAKGRENDKKKTKAKKTF